VPPLPFPPAFELRMIGIASPPFPSNIDDEGAKGKVDLPR
jgi:hypothetical protein